MAMVLYLAALAVFLVLPLVGAVTGAVWAVGMLALVGMAFTAALVRGFRATAGGPLTAGLAALCTPVGWALAYGAWPLALAGLGAAGPMPLGWERRGMATLAAWDRELLAPWGAAPAHGLPSLLQEGFVLTAEGALAALGLLLGLALLGAWEARIRRRRGLPRWRPAPLPATARDRARAWRRLERARAALERLGPDVPPAERERRVRAVWEAEREVRDAVDHPRA